MASVPAYVYHESKPTAAASAKKSLPASPFGIEKSEKTEAQAQNMASDNQPQSQSSRSQKQETKSKKSFDDALLKILRAATVSKIVYPRVAADFRVSGTVKVGFWIAPSGQISRVSLVSSSGFGPYDNAVMNAVMAISPVSNVAQYLPKAKFITAIIVFN